MGRAAARCVGTAVAVLLVVGSSAPPATAASTAVQAASASGTPVIPPPRPTPTPFTCTPSKKTGRCVKVKTTCKTSSTGTKTCVTRKVTCKRVGKYKICKTTVVTCTTPKPKKGKKAKRTCKTTSQSQRTSRISAAVTTGSIARIVLREGGGTGPPQSPATELVSTSGTPPMGVIDNPDPGGRTAVPAAAGVGVLVLVLALVGITVARRPRRQP